MVRRARNAKGHFVRRRHRRRSHNARRVVVVNTPRRRRRHRMNARRRHRNPHYRVRYRSRPRRHRRRNPAGTASIRLTRPMTYVPMLLTAGSAAAVSAMAPRVLGPNVSTMQAYLVQGVVALGGAIVLPMLGLRVGHTIAWLSGAGAPIVVDLFIKRVMHWFGLSVYPYSSGLQLSQEPYYPPRLYAYPYGGGGQPMFQYAPQEHVGAPEAPFEHMYNS